MANTFSSIFLHVVFSTKHRQRFITQEIENDVWSEIGEIVNRIGCRPIRVGGFDDHIHALIRVPPKYAPSETVKKIKSNSSRQIRNTFRGMRGFGWQDGFSAFSVSKSAVPQVVAYIENQREHHSRITYEEEYFELLRLHEVDVIDERFIFG